MCTNNEADLQYDSLASALNEIYGVYRVTLHSGKLWTTGGAETFQLRVHMRSVDANGKSLYVDEDFIDLEPGGSEPHGETMFGQLTFQSFNEIESIEVHGIQSISGD